MTDIKETLHNLFEKLHVQPVGNGYIDCICPKENIGEFISALDKLNVKIDGFTWWCFSVDGHQACGMGGPKNQYGNGFYSEMYESTLIEFKDNESYKHYLLNEFPNSSNYKECLVPGFWLTLP